MKALIKEARTWFDTVGNEAAESDDDDEYAKKASAWYHVTYHPSYWGCYNKDMGRDHFLSFAWCAFEKLIAIKRDNASIKRALHLSSVKRQFNGEFDLAGEV